MKLHFKEKIESKENYTTIHLPNRVSKPLVRNIFLQKYHEAWVRRARLSTNL